LIEIIVSPAGSGRYRAECAELGGLLCEAREPFFAAARRLLAQGVDPHTQIQMRHAGSSVGSLISTVGAAAKLAVRETDTRGPKIVPWKASPFADVRPPIASNDQAARVMAPTAQARPRYFHMQIAAAAYSVTGAPLGRQ
jgi:hypothetical protein